MNTNFLLKALPHALANEQGCSLTDIDMPTDMTAGENLRITIAGVTHEIPYQIALEMVVNYFAKDFNSAVDGYYPIVHLHRDDILSHHGHYISSRLSAEEIENLAYNFWDDSFADSYRYTLDYLLECHHSDLLHAPEKAIEDRLADELCAFAMYPHNFEQDFILDFLKAEVARDVSEDQLGYLGTSLVKRFLTSMQVANVVPEHIDRHDILDGLNYRDYQQDFLVALRAKTQADFPEYLPDIQIADHQIRGLLAIPYKAGLSVSQALAKYLPKIKADWDENRAIMAKIQARRDYDNPRSSRMDNTLNLCDAISDKLLAVKISGDKDGISLRLPDVDAERDVEHLVTLKYHDEQLQVIIKNVTSETIAQIISLTSDSS